MQNENEINLNKKPEWWKPAIKSGGSACLCCGATAEILDMKTKLYFGITGGWNILKNGSQFFL